MNIPNADHAIIDIEKLMKTPIQLLDVVALNENLPGKNLFRGQVGTVAELLAPNVFEVEFNDDNGQTYAMLALRADQLMVLHYQPLATV